MNRFAEVTDGLSNTVLIVGSAGKPTPYNSRTPVAGSNLYSGPWSSDGARVRIQGVVPITDPAATLMYGGECVINCTNSNEIYSFHTGGANFLFGDGSIRYVSDRVKLSTFWRFIIRAEGEPTPGDAV